MKSQSHFFENWNHKVNNSFLNEIKLHFENPNCPTLGELSFQKYQIGIKINNEILENGLYIFCFSNAFYVGKATSCTLIERLAKHFDSRKVGGFNGLLKKMGSDGLNLDNFPKNQEILMKSKVLLLPINRSYLKKQNVQCNQNSCIEDLEMDLIIKLEETLKLPTKNSKKRVTLSDYFF